VLVRRTAIPPYRITLWVPRGIFEAQSTKQAGRCPTEELAQVLDELEWHRWLVSEPRGYSFLARVVRQVVAQDMLTPGQRQRVLDAAARLSAPSPQLTERESGTGP